MNYQKQNNNNKKTLSTKGLMKDLINNFSILNGAKYFSSGFISRLFTIDTS